MRKIVLLLTLALFVLDAGAQGIQRTRSGLSQPDPYTRSKVEVAEEPDAARAVSAADRIVQRTKITGYRVSLFRDNSQTAGENARSVAAQFREQYPGIPVQVVYESPYFKVTAGNFVDKADAIALCGKALHSFPKAVVTQEEITVSDIVSQQKSVSEAAADENVKAGIGD